jgi:hypothetical protein
MSITHAMWIYGKGLVAEASEGVVSHLTTAAVKEGGKSNH